MLTEYIRAAMRKAVYEILPDDNTFHGEIPDFQGIWANADTLEACREELQEVLEEWIFFRISRNLPVPVVEGIELPIKEGVWGPPSALSSKGPSGLLRITHFVLSRRHGAPGTQAGNA